MADKTMMTNGNQFANKTVALDLCLFPNHDAFLNFCERSDKAIIPDAAAIEVQRLNKFYIDAKFYINDPGFKYNRFIHRHYFFLPDDKFFL